ncbi:MAG: M48 family metallopeptidase [Myxococcota bacterium]|nr:M48 family metallopeptidase [Myxococcota bacterium]
MTRRGGLAAALLLAALLGCASLDRPEIDREALGEHHELLRTEARQHLHAVYVRIQTVAVRLSLASAPLCEHVGPVLGAAIARRKDFVAGGNDTEVERTFGVSERVTVLALAEASPAGRAGLRPGDRILAVDGEEIDRTSDVFRRLRGSDAGSPTLRIEREGEIRELRLPRSDGCAQGFMVFVGSGADTVRHRNGQEVLVPTGLVDFARDDDELAIALSHQLAHNVLGRMWRAEDEPPADRLGLFMAARAGYDVGKAPAFWDRLAADEPWKISDDMQGGRNLHAAMALRAPVIRDTVEEIERRIAAGDPLVPAGE